MPRSAMSKNPAGYWHRHVCRIPESHCEPARLALPSQEDGCGASRRRWRVARLRRRQRIAVLDREAPDRIELLREDRADDVSIADVAHRRARRVERAVEHRVSDRRGVRATDVEAEGAGLRGIASNERADVLDVARDEEVERPTGSELPLRVTDGGDRSVDEQRDRAVDHDPR